MWKERELIINESEKINDDVLEFRRNLSSLRSDRFSEAEVLCSKNN